MTKWLQRFFFAVGAIGMVWLALHASDARAEDVVLDWTNPVGTETCTGAGPLTNLAGTRIWQFVTEINDPNVETFTVSAQVPGEYRYVATSFNTDGVGSRISGEAVRTVTTFTVSDTRAYTVVKSSGGFIAFVIGTVPLGTACDPNNMVKGEFNFLPFTGYAVPVQDVTVTGDIEPSAVVAECS